MVLSSYEIFKNCYFFCFIVKLLYDNSRDVYSDPFGNIYDEDSPFSIGKIESGYEGKLHSDPFGSIYVGDSPFSIGEIHDASGREGTVHRDDFGHIYIGSSPFESEDIKDVLNIED